MFSSTIIGLKLLPTTVLHHKHTGEIIISVLLMQDLIAIVILMLLPAEWTSSALLIELGKLVMSLLGLILVAWFFSQYVLLKLIRRFNRIHEYIFLMAIGWCLSMAELAHAIGLSPEIGAFIAGVMLAANPIALFIAENLKPLRDFFLVIFFFSLGASFDLSIVNEVLWPSIVLATIFLVLKPVGFGRLLQAYGEEPYRAREVGVRLGQISEFSLFIAVLALDSGVISSKASYLIQVSTLLSFVVSSWFIVLRYPTPIAVSEALRRD
jgi:Kef-type K+ transport system membrane component KefB